jgi:hypothetical protein
VSATEPDAELLQRARAELRAFRLAGAHGFARGAVSMLRDIAMAILHPRCEDEDTVDDVLIAAIAFCVSAELRGQNCSAVRVHLGLERVPVEVSARMGFVSGSPDLAGHKHRAAAAAIIANYNKDHYVEAVLAPTMRQVAHRLVTTPPSLHELGLVSQQQEHRSPFTVASHQFIPVWLGKSLASAFVVRYSAGRCVVRGLSCLDVVLPIPRGRAVLFEFGVLVIHIREELAFETIAALAKWRRISYRTAVDEIADALEGCCQSIRARCTPPPSPSHVLSVYYVLQRGWPADEEQAAVAMLAIPSVLLERPDHDRPDDVHMHNEDAYLRGGFDSPELHQFGMPQVAHGYAAWSGVAYAPLDGTRALSEDDLVELELATQAVWCYADVVADSSSAAIATTLEEHHAVRRSITRVGARENTQLCLAREAIVLTSRVEDLLAAAQDSIVVVERNK